MVYTWGDQTAKEDWASAAKPVLHTLLFFAVQEKRIASLDERIGNWVLAGTGGTLRPEDEPITFAQLMNMTSGYAVIDPPGAAWAYNDVASNLKNKLIGAILGEPLDGQLRRGSRRCNSKTARCSRRAAATASRRRRATSPASRGSG